MRRHVGLLLISIAYAVLAPMIAVYAQQRPQPAPTIIVDPGSAFGQKLFAEIVDHERRTNLEKLAVNVGRLRDPKFQTQTPRLLKDMRKEIKVLCREGLCDVAPSAEDAVTLFACENVLTDAERQQQLLRDIDAVRPMIAGNNLFDLRARNVLGRIRKEVELLATRSLP